jgi:hypothetical protein
MQAAPRFAWEEENGGSGSAAFAAPSETAEAEGSKLRSPLPYQREAVLGFPLKRKKEGVERSFRHA